MSAESSRCPREDAIAAPCPGGPPALVGRAAELDIAAGVLAGAARGQAQVLLITGEAGIGKTRLAEEITKIAYGPVRFGACVPGLGSTFPYGPFATALADRADRLFGEAGADTDPALRRQAFERTLAELDELAAVAADGPLVLVLEDLHWADESSLQLLDFLAVRLAGQRIVVIGTLRDELPSSMPGDRLAELARRPRVIRLDLARLGDDAIGHLAAGCAGPHASPERIAAIVAAAEGNPFYALELARADGEGPPATLISTVCARLNALDTAAREIVELVAVSGAGGTLPHELVAELVSLTEHELLDATGRAVASGLLAAAGEGIRRGP